MFSHRTLLPNVQLLLPPSCLDREHLSGHELETTGGELPTIMIVDLREIQSMDCAGIGWLVNLQINMSAQGKTLLLLKPSVKVTSVFHKADIESQFLMAEDLVQAQNLLSALHPELLGTRIICAK